MPKVLVIEDNPAQNQALTDWFGDNGYQVDNVFNCADAENCLKISSYDLIVIDWELPDGEGVSVIANNRRRGLATPVLMLTGKTTLDDKEQGFESGADDYLTKPFQERELAARVRALLRRPAAYVDDTITVGDLSISQGNKTVKVGEAVIPFTPKEYDILILLAKNPDTVFSAETILRRAWDTESETTADSIRKYIQRVRTKLEKHGCSTAIATHHSIGYSLRQTDAGQQNDS